jgi:phosphoserine phosphatase
MAQEFVATLIASSDKKLSLDFLESLAGQVSATGTAWIKKSIAADLFFTSDVVSVAGLYAPFAKAIADQPFDILIQPAASRRKKLLLADMESTIIEQEMLDELADIIGQRDKVASITRRAMNGELDFASALRERVALLKGQPASILNDAAARITLMPGAAELLTVMKAQGATCWLVSGGFTCFVKPVAERLGFDRFFANELIVKDGVITGEVVEPILDKTAKKALLAKACAAQKISLAESMAVGDGANDVPMLQACIEGGGLGVAYQAKPKVRAAIPNQINYGNLTALLYAQGVADIRL